MTTTTTTFEMLWDCPNCGAKGNLAKTHRECPGCGAAQSGKRYPPERNQRVAAVSERRGPDWACLHCGAYNPAMERSCSGCSAPKGSSPPVPMMPVTPVRPVLKPVSKPVSKPEPEVFSMPPRHHIPTPSPPPVPRPRPEPVFERPVGMYRPAPVIEREIVRPDMSIWKNPLTYILPTAAIMIAGIVTCALYTRDVSAEVQNHTWKREVQVESLVAETDSAWCSHLPQGAVILNTSRDIRSHRDVVIGQDCETIPAHCDPAPSCSTKPVCQDAGPPKCELIDNGDGTMDEKCTTPEPKCTTPKCPKPVCTEARRECKDRIKSEPVYESKCTFNILRWKDLRRDVTNGNSLEQPFWPDTPIVCQDEKTAGCQRIARKSESYVVHMRDSDGKAFDCDLSETTWKTFPVGSKWMTHKGIMGRPDCNTMLRLGSP